MMHSNQIRAIPFEILRGAEWKKKSTTPTYFIFFAEPRTYFNLWELYERAISFDFHIFTHTAPTFFLPLCIFLRPPHIFFLATPPYIFFFGDPPHILIFLRTIPHIFLFIFPSSGSQMELPLCNTYGLMSTYVNYCQLSNIVIFLSLGRPKHFFYIPIYTRNKPHASLNQIDNIMTCHQMSSC